MPQPLLRTASVTGSASREGWLSNFASTQTSLPSLSFVLCVWHGLSGAPGPARGKARSFGFGRVAASRSVSLSTLGRYCELSLRTGQARRGATCPIAGHLQAPEFAFDPDVGSLVIRSSARGGQDAGCIPKMSLSVPGVVSCPNWSFL